MKRQVLLLYGGESSEHDVSIASATNVYAALDKNKFNVTLGYIDEAGCWWLTSALEKNPEKDGVLLPLLGQAAFSVNGEVISPDVIIPILHGPNGEDGSVQALAQLLHIPIVGSDMTASAIGMSKRRAKQIAQASGSDVLPLKVHRSQDEMPQYETLKQTLGDALFVKPDGAGSSLGANRATDQESLEAALSEAHRYGEVVLIEAGLDHPRELEVAVLGNYPDIRTSAVAEIRPAGEFYSFDSKYDSSSTSEVMIPADLPDELRDRIQTEAKNIYIALGCSGMTRVDFFLSNDRLYFNEANTIPGFTNISVYPKAWAHEGLSNSELIETLIDLAL